MSDKPSIKWPARDLNGNLVMVVDGAQYDAIKAKLEAMEAGLRAISGENFDSLTVERRLAALAGAEKEQEDE